MDKFFETCVNSKAKLIFHLPEGKVERGTMIDFSETEIQIARCGQKKGWIIINRRNYISFNRVPDPSDE